MPMHFEFATAPRIIFGAGTLVDAGPAARALGRRALVVTGADSGRAQPLLDILGEHQVATAVFSACGEPDVQTVRQATAIARGTRCDLVIGIGGGAAVDTAKAVAAMLTNDGDLLDYLEIVGRGCALANRPAPFMAIPTTAGAGAEVTKNSVIRSPEHRAKVSLRSPSLMAQIVIVDPQLAYDLPPGVTATTGMDALTQLIEPYVCRRANPMTDALCREGMTRVAASLRKAFADGHDLDAREDMAVAALFGGMALANSGLGAVHGIAGPLGGMVTAPHGAVCAALLPRVVEMNLRALRERSPDSSALDRYREVAALLAPADQTVDRTGSSPSGRLSPEVGDPAALLPARLERLVRDLGIPSLRAYGVCEDHLDELAVKAARANSMKANPIALTLDELKDVVKAAL